MMSVAAESASLPSSLARSPDFSKSSGTATRQRKVLRVARCEDSATTVSHRTTVLSPGAVRVYRKQAHTHSVRGVPPSSSEDEGMICKAMPAPRSASLSPTRRALSPAQRTLSPARQAWSPARLLRRGWLPDLSLEGIEAAAPLVAVTFAFGAFMTAAAILCKPHPPLMG